MKVLFFAFLALAIGANALPYEVEGDTENREGRFLVEAAIRDFVRNLSEWMRSNGMDPLQIERLRVENTPQPGVVVGLAIDQFTLTGPSDIVLHRVNYNAVFNRLQLEFSLPAIRASAGGVGLDLNIHGTEYSAYGSGDFTMLSLRITADMRLSILGGIGVRSVDATLRIQRLWSDVNLVINNEDYSDEVNKLINVRIPEFMRVHQRAIDEVVSQIIYIFGNAALDR